MVGIHWTHEYGQEVGKDYPYSAIMNV